MTKKERYYKITQKGDLWTARIFSKFCHIREQHIMLQKKAMDLKEFDGALMIRNFDKTYQLYLPTIHNGEISVNDRCKSRVKNIQSYQYFDGVFLLRLKNSVVIVRIAEDSFRDNEKLSRLVVVPDKNAYLESKKNSAYKTDLGDVIYHTKKGAYLLRREDTNPVFLGKVEKFQN